ncbi:MAG: hypothetical protein LBI63_02425, partial [Candidatus Ancillula sp.]|nr:hypothetical protein [Candidatus Ancillula sp.]
MWLMDKNAYRNSKLVEKNSAENSAENSASRKQLAQDNLHVAKSSTSIKKRAKNSLQKKDMRNFRNFHAKITPLIAVFALVAFSIFTFIKLPAFAQNSAQDLNKTEVLCGDSADPVEHEQDNSTQSVPSNQQVSSSGQNAQTAQNQQEQDNCVQTHSAGQDLESNSHITHLNTQNSAQVPSRVQSTTITPQASTGANIDLSDTTIANGTEGDGWSYTDGVYTINSDATADANLTISGTTTNKRVVVASGNATVTLNGASITSSSDSPITLSSGANLTLKLSGSNTLTSDDRVRAGLNVPDGATLTITSATGNGTSAEGSLTATGGEYGAGIGGGYSETFGTIIISGGTIHATGMCNGGAGIGGGVLGDGGTINISGGTIIAINGGFASAIGGGYNASGGSTTISGGTIIAIGGEVGKGNASGTTISEHPVILAPDGINGKEASDTNRANGILIGLDVSIDTSGTPITVTINADMTIPSGANFQVPEGVKVVVPEDKTLTVAGGGTITVAEGGQVINNGIVTDKFSGSEVSALTFASKTSTSITINPTTLLSTTEQDIEYAISTTNELPTGETDLHSTTSEGTITIEDGKVSFTGLNSDTQYYIFARAKENTTHKAGTAKQLGVKTAAQVAYTNSDDTGHSATPWWTFNSETGTLTINLENVYTTTGNPSVEVVGDACGGSDDKGAESVCRLSIQHVVFTNVDDHVTNLSIGAKAFQQFPVSGTNATLTSVVFPSTLTSLNIRERAFQQGYSDSLASVSFPTSLTTLTIGNLAFYQGTYTGTLLESVTFPASLTTLTIGDTAFGQYSESGNTAFKYAFLPSSHLPANTTVASNAFTSGKPIYWLGEDGASFCVSPTGGAGSSPALTQLPLVQITTNYVSDTLSLPKGDAVPFTNVQAVYGGGENQPRFPAVSGTVPLSPTTSDELDFTNYKILSTVSGGPDAGATITGNSIRFLTAGEHTVTLSVPGFSNATKVFIVNVTGDWGIKQIMATVDYANETLENVTASGDDEETIQDDGSYFINHTICKDDEDAYLTGAQLKTADSLTEYITSSSQNLTLTHCDTGSDHTIGIQTFTLPARPSAPTQGENTFQVTGAHVYTDEYETLAIQPGYEYYKLSSSAGSEDTCSNTTTGYT